MGSTEQSGSTQSLGALQGRLGYRFKDSALLERALTHASTDTKQSYERLEFLGDRVLGLVIADLLYRRFGEEPEGALAKRHTGLVRLETLARVGRELGLGAALRLEGGDLAEHRGNPSLIADSCEAVLAAIFLDGGYKAAEDVVVRFWTPLLEEDLTPPQDPKTALQEWAQAKGLALPSYKEVSRSGPDHALHFVIEVSLEGHGPARGEGNSKRAAEKAAADQLLSELGI